MDDSWLSEVLVYVAIFLVGIGWEVLCDKFGSPRSGDGGGGYGGADGGGGWGDGGDDGGGGDGGDGGD